MLALSLAAWPRPARVRAALLVAIGLSGWAAASYESFRLAAGGTFVESTRTVLGDPADPTSGRFIYLTDPEMFTLTQGEVRVLSEGLGGRMYVEAVGRNGTNVNFTVKRENLIQPQPDLFG